MEGSGGNTHSTGSIREDLAQRWNELKTPLADRVECLAALLDAAQATPEVVSRYEGVVEKLSARQPIAQVNGGESDVYDSRQSCIHIFSF